MVLHRTLKVAVAAVVTLVSIIPTAVAEEIAQAAHIEAEIAGSCYSQGCSTLSIEFPVEERIGSGESGSISILTEC